MCCCCFIAQPKDAQISHSYPLKIHLKSLICKGTPCQIFLINNPIIKTTSSSECGLGPGFEQFSGFSQYCTVFFHTHNHQGLGVHFPREDLPQLLGVKPSVSTLFSGLKNHKSRLNPDPNFKKTGLNPDPI